MNAPVAGSYSSAVASRPPTFVPPANSTFPVPRNVAVCSDRGAAIDPVACTVPRASVARSTQRTAERREDTPHAHETSRTSELHHASPPPQLLRRCPRRDPGGIAQVTTIGEMRISLRTSSISSRSGGRAPRWERDAPLPEPKRHVPGSGSSAAAAPPVGAPFVTSAPAALLEDPVHVEDEVDRAGRAVRDLERPVPAARELEDAVVRAGLSGPVADVARRSVRP